MSRTNRSDKDKIPKDSHNNRLQNKQSKIELNSQYKGLSDRQRLNCSTLRVLNQERDKGFHFLTPFHFFEGVAAPQANKLDNYGEAVGQFIGGGNQIFIPNVHPSWLK